MVPPSSLVAVPIESFRRGTRDINFDVFLKLSDDNVAHVFSKTTGLDYKRLASYVQKGVTHLYVREEDQEAYRAFADRPAEAIFNDPGIAPERKIAALLNMTEQNMSEVFSQINVREETASDTRKLVTSYVELMARNPQSLAVILKLVSHGEYLYYHAIAVSIFSLFIAKASGQFNRKSLETIGMGGFLHDIGCIHLPKEIICSPNAFNDDEWEAMKQHPRLGLEMLTGARNISDEVRYIVYQHHEEPCGKGYPNAIPGPTIYYPARVVALADAFSALISKRPHRSAFSAELSIRILQDDPSKFDRKLVEILASVILQGGQKAA